MCKLRFSFKRFVTASVACFAFGTGLLASQAFAFSPDTTTSGKLALTGGVSQLEGSGGGGLTPWALIGGDGTRDQIGASAYYSLAQTQNYGLVSKGVAIGFFDRVELSYAHQDLNTRDVGVALGAGPDFHINQDIYGLKVKVYGDAVLDQDSFIPQIAVGGQYKHNQQGAVPQIPLIGATSDSGFDYYVALTKIFLNPGIVADITLRETKANQMGLLGFGGPNNNNYQLMVEASLGVLLTDHLVLGGEYRQKPNNLSGDALNIQETSFEDAFVAWSPTKNLSLTVAYAWLGDVAVFSNQNGFYGSVQASF